jgi:hypothetical protein
MDRFDRRLLAAGRAVEARARIFPELPAAVAAGAEITILGTAGRVAWLGPVTPVAGRSAALRGGPAGRTQWPTSSRRGTKAAPDARRRRPGGGGPSPARRGRHGPGPRSSPQGRRSRRRGPSGPGSAAFPSPSGAGGRPRGSPSRCSLRSRTSASRSNTTPPGPAVIDRARRHGLSVHDALHPDLALPGPRPPRPRPPRPRLGPARAARDPRHRAGTRGGSGGGRGGPNPPPRPAAAGREAPDRRGGWRGRGGALPPRRG